MQHRISFSCCIIFSHLSSNRFCTFLTSRNDLPPQNTVRLTMNQTHSLSPSYTSLPALRRAEQRIIDPPTVVKDDESTEKIHYEHYVGTWACTMLKHAFHDGKWAITPEKADIVTKKKPDLFVEEVVGDEFRTHLLMELKSNDPTIRFEDAVAQVVKEIGEMMEKIVECFVIVQCGTRIAFFDYHNDQSEMDFEGISHFRGLVSLTKDFRGKIAMQNKPDDLLPIYHNTSRLRSQTKVREEASEYEEECVFDLTKHKDHIDFLFDYVSCNRARDSDVK